MKKFEHNEGLPGGPNEIKVSGFFDNDMFNLNTGYSKKGDKLSFASNANFNSYLPEKTFNTDINAMLKANLLKGLTGSVGGNININERGESVFNPNLDLKYHSNNLDAKVGYSGDKKIKAGLSGHKDFKSGLSIQGSVDSGYDLDKNKFIAPQVNAGLTYNFQAGGNAMYLTDDEISNYKAGGYTVIEEFEEGGDNGKKSKSDAYVKNVMGLLDKDGVHPLDLVYGNKELGIPKMGTLAGLQSVPELQDYFFDPYGDMMDTYIEQRGDPKEQEAATKRKRENYLNNVQRTEEEDQAYEENLRKEEEIASAKAYEEECKDPMSECWKRNAQRAYQASRDYDDSGQFVKDLGSMIGDGYAEMTYKPIVRTAKKAYNDPIGLVTDLNTTAGDLMASPFTASKELYDYTLGDGNFEFNKVFDTEALGTSLDALSVIPVAKGVGTAFKTAKPIIKYADNVLMNAPRAKMTLNSGVNPSMMVNAYQDTRNAIKGMKFPFSKTNRQLDKIKGSGAYWDDVGIPGKDLASKTDMVEYVGTKSGRPVVNVKMPDGTTQGFYKSVGNPAKGGAGKVGQGVSGTTEGMWQPFGGFTDHPRATNWFIKDAGYKNFYGSKTYKGIAGELDNTLMKKLGAKNVDELDDFINFQKRNRPGDDFIPDYNHGGVHAGGYSSTRDDDTYTEVLSNRPNDSYEYQRKKDLKSGNLSYFQRKKGTDTWNSAGTEGTRGYRAITSLFGEDETGYATSQDRKDFINELLIEKAQKEANEKAAEEQPVDKAAELTDYYKANAPWMSLEQIEIAVNNETGQTSKNLQSTAEALYGKKQPVFGGPSSGNTVVAGGSDFYERDKSASNIGIGDGLTAKEAATEFVEAVPGMLAEGSGFNAAKRLYDKGAKQVVGDLANTAADIVGGTGEAIYEAGDYLVGDGSFDMSGTNWMTGNEYGSGLGTVLDVASIIPAAGVLGKTAKASKYLKPIINPIKKGAGDLSALGKKGLNWATNKVGSVEVPGINTNWTGGNAITFGDVGNATNSLLKYNPLQKAGINSPLIKNATGWGALTGLGIDNTVRGDNTFSDIASGNFDLNKSALGRYSINAADDLSLINDSRKSQATINTINEGYTFGDAAKIGINLSPMKFLGKPLSSGLKAEAQLTQAPKYIAKALKKGTDKGGVYAHEDIENNTPVKTAGIKQAGGTSNYSEQYLTDTEIEALIAQGYTVEDFN